MAPSRFNLLHWSICIFNCIISYCSYMYIALSHLVICDHRLTNELFICYLTWSNGDPWVFGCCQCLTAIRSTKCDSEAGKCNYAVIKIKSDSCGVAWVCAPQITFDQTEDCQIRNQLGSRSTLTQCKSNRNELWQCVVVVGTLQFNPNLRTSPSIIKAHSCGCDDGRLSTKSLRPDGLSVWHSR